MGCRQYGHDGLALPSSSLVSIQRARHVAPSTWPHGSLRIASRPDKRSCRPGTTSWASQMPQVTSGLGPWRVVSHLSMLGHIDSDGLYSFPPAVVPVNDDEGVGRE